MKSEIEARLLECDTQNILTKLKENNATFAGDWLQLRYCYDFNPVQKNSWIRLRTNGIETTLTIKEIQSSKIANLQFAMNGTGTVSRGQNEGILDKAIRTVF